MKKTRAIRFSANEEKQIEKFLKQNSFFDFSSLARTAILSFIKQPTVKIRPIRDDSRRASQEVSQ